MLTVYLCLSWWRRQEKCSGNITLTTDDFHLYNKGKNGTETSLGINIGKALPFFPKETKI